MPDPDLRAAIEDAVWEVRVEHARCREYDRHASASYADAILALPAIVAGQAALALLAGDRRGNAICALEDALEPHVTAARSIKAARVSLDTLAALLPNGAPNAA